LVDFSVLVRDVTLSWPSSATNRVIRKPAACVQDGMFAPPIVITTRLRAPG
jgi:hypothetical protein